MSEKAIVTVTSRNTLKIQKSSNSAIEKTIQCEYFATSICSLILGESVKDLRVFFGSVIGDLIDWEPSVQAEPIKRAGHKGMIFSIVSDSSRVFTISDDRTIRMWSLKSRDSEPIFTVFGHTARPFTICVDPHKNLIYTGGIEQTLFCWKYDEEKIKLVKKTVLSIGVIRKITQEDESTLIISSQDGDIMKIDSSVEAESPTVLTENIVNFAHVKDYLLILSERNELIVYENDGMERIVFRCAGIKHMSSCDQSAVVWNQSVFVFLNGSHVHRIQLSVNIISAACDASCVAVKTIDGFINVYNLEDPVNVKLLKQFRPSNPAMIPSVFALIGDSLVLGSTHGELFHGFLSDEISPSLSRKDSFQLFGGKEVTCIEPIPGTSAFMTLGKTGVWTTFNISEENEVKILNSRNFSASSRVAWPSKFIDMDGNRVIVGFYGTSLILWNSTTGNPVFETYCGGGHRVWQICESVDPLVLHFNFIRDGDLCRQKICLRSKQHLVTTPHSSPIVATAGSRNYLVTVSLDGHISIATPEAKTLLTMFAGENLLCTDIKEYGDDAYVTTGGGKSKMSVWKFRRSSSDLQNNTFWLRHACRADEGRIVSTSVAKVRGSIFFIASYSSGTIEVFKNGEDSLDSVFTIEIEDLLGIGTKMTALEQKLFVGTSGSYLLTFDLAENGTLEKSSRTKLKDRSGVTAIAAASGAQNIIVGCDSGHVFNVDSNGHAEIIHSHLSTVVGIVAEQPDLAHSVSLDCTVITSTSSGFSKKATIVDMPGGMVKTGDRSLAVVGDGIQLFLL
ncbi:unnamed protein product [Caenorhabditis sp. 36 PRJEB53466]|nr:unnamed protein product [Caenorhabditis sp. 36 PRJEB53466]